ncbi:hypothetical protein HN388_00685 [bacterium]|nr:hypothetical protein [bacterium]MBT4292252.1 hypothetical protein [bacterium]
MKLIITLSALLIFSAAVIASPTVKTACELDDYATVFITGSFVEILVHGNGSDIPVRIASQSATISHKPSLRKAPFLAVVNEDHAGGNWGLSSNADDDQDGEINEDRFDGIDNDNDGLIDEDFAAIGHQMSVTEIRREKNSSHTETYHWDYVSLDKTLFVVFDRTDTGLMTLSNKSNWHIAPLDPAYPERVFYATDAGDKIVGALLLDRSEIPKIDRGTIGFPFEGKATWAITVASNAATLRSQLVAAENIYDGAVLKSGEKATSWIMSAGCALCIKKQEIDANYYIDENNRIVIEFNITKGSNSLFDPNAFTLGDKELGSPGKIEWESEASWSTKWINAKASDLWKPETVAPYCKNPEFLQHTAEGKLRFVFSASASYSTKLSGKYLSGKPFKAEIKLLKRTKQEPEEAIFTEPVLSPTLLSNHPNPFNQQTTIKFIVPVTVGEGLVWGDSEQPTLNSIEMMPYSSSAPSVSLRVYTVAGREISILENASLGTGSYTSSWDGKDSIGRNVAAGTYFCKLQIDKWSVTKRITLVR